MHRSVSAFALVLSVVANSTHARTQSWLINELKTGSGEVELINVSGTAADPSGLCLWAKEIFGNACTTAGLPPFLHLEIPVGTPSVAPGGTITLESGSVFCGLGMTRNTSWQSRSELIVILNRDPMDWTQGIVDLLSLGDTNTVFHVRNTFNPGGAHWSGGPVMRPGTGFCDLVYRPRDAATGLPRDSDTAADWQVSSNVRHTPCAPNPTGEPNPMTLGEGYAASGNCAAQRFTNTSTELPTLTLATCTFDPRPGSSLQFAIRTGMSSAPPITCLLIGNPLTTPAPVPFGPCAGTALTYLDPATATSVCHLALPWDAHVGADLPPVPIPNNAGLIGAQFVVQGFVLDPSAGACPLRTTNGLRVEIEP